MGTAWNRWWVAMWVGIAAILLGAVFYMEFWHWWTFVAFAFGIPEIIGSWVKNDQFPPLTHIIIRYTPIEIGLPILYFFSGAIGSFWVGFKHPMRLGFIVGAVGWLTAHFLPRWLQK